MSEKNIYEIIEELNFDYISSRNDLRFARRFLKYWDNLKQFHIIKIFKDLYLFCINITDRKTFLSSMNSNVSIHAKPQGKVVVYGCIAGPYDIPREPLVPEPDVDYVLYTDQINKREDTVWQYRDIPEKVLRISPNGKVRNEYIRTHPKEFFPDYDYAIYIDGNMRIMSDVSSWAALVRPVVGIAMHKLCARDCVYKHGKELIASGRGNKKGVRAQMAYYRADGLPKNNGVLETPVIVTDLQNPVIAKIYDFWWEDFCKWNSCRDQMSLPYVLWKLGIAIEDVGTLGGNVWCNPKLRAYPHEMKHYHIDWHKEANGEQSTSCEGGASL